SLKGKHSAIKLTITSVLDNDMFTSITTGAIQPPAVTVGTGVRVPSSAANMLPSSRAKTTHASTTLEIGFTLPNFKFQLFRGVTELTRTSSPTQQCSAVHNIDVQLL
ncbi:unnamed protein product, partial [Ectocarpus sp. 12 AP-2014]